MSQGPVILYALIEPCPQAKLWLFRFFANDKRSGVLWPAFKDVELFVEAVPLCPGFGFGGKALGNLPELLTVGSDQDHGHKVRPFWRELPVNLGADVDIQAPWQFGPVDGDSHEVQHSTTITELSPFTEESVGFEPTVTCATAVFKITL